MTYSQNRYDDLMYATNASGGWVTQLADSSGRSGYHSTVEVDSTGVIHAVHYVIGGTTDFSVRHASTWSGSFSSDRVDPWFRGGAAHLTMALTSDDVPHIFYPARGASGTVFRRAFRVRDGIDQDCNGRDG